MIGVSSKEDGYDNVGVLVLTSLDMEKSWVMNFRYFYHMCPSKE